MKHFISRFLLCLIIFFLLLTPAILWDPFKVFFYYKDYYTNEGMTGNRDIVTLSIFNHNPGKRKLANFIIGSSRSHAFKTGYWAPLINQPPDKCFHFDGYGLGLFRSANLFTYIEENVDKIDNILLIIDAASFEELENPTDHRYSQPPAISHEFAPVYYFRFFKASLNPTFIASNALHNFTSMHFGFMDQYIVKSPYNTHGDNLTADIWYPYDEEIAKDSVAYYSRLDKANVFYKREHTGKMSPPLIANKQLVLLHKMAGIVARQKCNLQIIVSPMYSQVGINPADLETLRNIFGQDHVHDFSGINPITENKYNYYESSHFRPHVANMLMDAIYQKKS